jgi:hypothetical protein
MPLDLYSGSTQFGWSANYPDEAFHDFTQSLQGNVMIVP